MTLQIPPGVFWGKLHPRENPTTYHPLLAHSADVAAVLRHLLTLHSVLGRRLAHSAGLDTLPHGLVARLVYLAALHDLGKVNHSFQDQWRRGARPSRGHVQIVLASLRFRPLRQVLQEALMPLRLPSQDATELLYTTICHHGKPWPPESNPVESIWQDDPHSGRSPLSEIRRLAGLARLWSGLDEAVGEDAPPLTTRFLHLYAGALTLADWIGSTQAAFAFDPAAEDDPHDYWQRAQERAGRACTAIGLTPSSSVVSLSGLPLLERIFPAVFGARQPAHLAHARPTPLQTHIAEMELPAPGSRVLVESETGSGKTEAALALYARLRATGRVGGLVFALPTRATASAMHRRVADAIEAMYEPGARPTLALAMGGEQAHAALAQGEADAHALTADEPDTYPDAGERELVCWSSGSAKKFFAAEVVVGTLDQLLLGALAVKHAHLRLAALSRHLLVVDELHSYDRYMAEVLQQILDMTSAAGGVSLLMSATLSDRERLRFGGLITSDYDEQTPYDEAVRRPYPVVSVCTEPGTEWMDTELAAASGPPKPPLHWRACGEAEALDRAIAAARAGARVCVLRSTVKGARATIETLRERLGDEADARLWRPNGTPHTPAYHSRYALADRQALDAAVLESFSRGRTAGEGRILVATQVAEQSLDVDFDVMITDLCPIDVLLQRLGRVWRHRERDEVRPECCRAAQAWVIEPEDSFDALLATPRNGRNGWGTVYQHLGFLELTRRAIRERPTVRMPDDNRALIEAVYHEQPLLALRAGSEAWDAHFSAQEGQTLTHELTAKGVVVRFDDSYIANAERFQRDITGSVRTRLGDDRVRVALPAPLACIYAPGETADAVDLPYEQAQRSGADLENPRATGGARDGDTMHYELGTFAFRYGPQGWEWGPS